MTNGAVAGGAAAAAGAAIANAIRAFGAIVTVEPREFEAVLARAEAPLVVCGQGGLFSTYYQYLMAYKGLFFYTKTPTPLPLGGNVQIVNAKKLLLPG
ncbi:MAG: hypothetical protein JW955_17535 [Sedimentisphaerales bacterium]|nr:hypothetical protein [Sedimentisphaerales bacterium]